MCGVVSKMVCLVRETSSASHALSGTSTARERDKKGRGEKETKTKIKPPNAKTNT